MRFGVLLRVLDPAYFVGLHVGCGGRFRYGDLEEGEVVGGLHERFENAEECVAPEITQSQI